jgi:hypothetical protein
MKSTIRRPDAHPAFTVSRAKVSGPRFGMVTEDTFDEAIMSLCVTWCQWLLSLKVSTLSRISLAPKIPAVVKMIHFCHWFLLPCKLSSGDVTPGTAFTDIIKTHGGRTRTFHLGVLVFDVACCFSTWHFVFDEACIVLIALNVAQSLFSRMWQTVMEVSRCSQALKRHWGCQPAPRDSKKRLYVSRVQAPILFIAIAES